MNRKLSYLICAVAIFIMAGGVPAGAAVPIDVENYSFEIPDDGQKRDIEVGTPGLVTGWARVDPTTSAGREFGYTPTEGTATAFFGKDCEIFNFTGQKVGTEFLAMDGDEFQLQLDARSTWHGCILESQLYYYDAGDHVVFATMDVNLIDYPSMTTHTLDSNAIGLAGRDRRIGIQFKHRYEEGLWDGDDNIWAGFDYIRLRVTTPVMRAQEPYPEHESFYVGDDVTLTWVAGPNTTSVDNYQVYFSDDWTDVNAGASAADEGLTGGSTSKSISGLVKGETYYWRIDTIIGTTTYRGNIWNFTTKPLLAYDPDPSDSQDYVPVEPTLSWEAGSGAVEGHVVFFGDTFNSVNNAPVGTSGPAPFRAYLTDVNDTNWAPSEAGLTPLGVSTTYYWRIDEVEVNPGTIHKGNVWSFTTVPVPGIGSILCELYEEIDGVTVDDLTSADIYPDNPSTIENLLSFEAPHRAIVNYGSRVHGWLYIDTSDDYTFWIASGENSQLWLSTDDTQEHASIIAYVDGEDGRDGWTSPREWDKYPEIQQSEPISLVGGNVYYIMVLHKKGWGHDNLSVAWSITADVNTAEIIPGKNLIPFERLNSYNPNPANGATDVQRDPNLSWTPGPFAATHDVYFGTDETKVTDANRSVPLGVKISQGQTENTLDIANEIGNLEFDTTYYWRIDDFNDSNFWKGNVWRFTTGHFLVVDDFESYNPNLEDTWKTNAKATASLTTDPVNSGAQAMAIDFNNLAASPYYSEVYADTTGPNSLGFGKDWSIEGVKSLSLRFRGILDLDGSFTINGSMYTIEADGWDIWAMDDGFHFAYKSMGGPATIKAKVESIENTDPWAKAGVMIRDTLDPGSINVMVAMTPGNGVTFQYREDTDDETVSVSDANFALPYWVKLTFDEVSEDFGFTAEHSSDDITWTQIGDFVQVSDFHSTSIYIGLCVTSHSYGDMCTAEFSNVSTTGAVSGDWQSQDIGIQSNDAEKIYVVLEDGNSDAIIYHDDPEATTIDTWTEWRIDLNDFTDVSRTDVNRIYIGVGERGNTTIAGGSGTIYIDDIRLYQPDCYPSAMSPWAIDLFRDCVIDHGDVGVIADNWLINGGWTVEPEEINPLSDPNLVAYYAFENNTQDSSGNEHHGDPCGTPTYVSGKVGYAISFDINDAVVTNESLLNDLPEFSLVGWVSNIANADDSRIGLFGQNDCVEFGFDNGDIHAWASGDGQLRREWSISPDDSTWHHIALVGDGQGLTIYIDGMAVVIVNSAVEDTYGTSTYGFNIGGAGIFDEPAADGNWLNGKLDEVQVYNRALSHGEVAYLAGKEETFTQPLYMLLTPQNPNINLYDDNIINFRDIAELGKHWGEEQVWPTW